MSVSPPAEPRRCECGAALLPNEKKCWLCNSAQSSPLTAPQPDSYYPDTTSASKRQRTIKTIGCLGTSGALLAIAGMIVGGGNIQSMGAGVMLFGPPLVLTGAFGALMSALLPGPGERGGCLFAGVIVLFLPVALVAWVFILCSGAGPIGR